MICLLGRNVVFNKNLLSLKYFLFSHLWYIIIFFFYYNLFSIEVLFCPEDNFFYVLDFNFWVELYNWKITRPSLQVSTYSIYCLIERFFGVQNPNILVVIFIFVMLINIFEVCEIKYVKLNKLCPISCFECCNYLMIVQSLWKCPSYLILWNFLRITILYCFHHVVIPSVSTIIYYNSSYASLTILRFVLS